MLDDVHTVKDGIALTKDGREAAVVEYTNTPEEFVDKMNKVGFMKAFGDKAAFRKSPLSNYQANVFYKTLQATTPRHRTSAVTKARKSLTTGKVFESYNMFLGNCEHAITVLE